ncbi:hypothetical protein E2C01_019632 [Portunus trituberculatus]|uniref:Uncharacterized protein n=1 Tax=Portunus trituberculatus TaxID=210409 RepID=A0A5B7DZW5_PORTR|nr:hypothetical protein [Portunus trituberculatus]
MCRGGDVVWPGDDGGADVGMLGGDDGIGEMMCWWVLWAVVRQVGLGLGTAWGRPVGGSGTLHGESPDLPSIVSRQRGGVPLVSSYTSPTHLTISLLYSGLFCSPCFASPTSLCSKRTLFSSRDCRFYLCLCAWPVCLSVFVLFSSNHLFVSSLASWSSLYTPVQFFTLK